MTAAGTSTAGISMRLHTPIRSPHPYNDMAAFMVDEVGSRSGGMIKIQVFEAGQLGNETAVIDEMCNGTIDLIVSTTNIAAERIPEFQVFSMPYLFPEIEGLMARVGPDTPAETYFRQVYLDRGLNMQLLALGGSGTRNLSNSRGPVRSLADISGLKMRTPAASPMVSRIWQRLGTLPVSVSWDDVYAAVQTDTVAAFECAIPGYAGSKLYKVAPHLALTAHSIQINHISISNSAWNRLDIEHQDMILDVARKASVLGIEKAMLYESNLVETLQSQHGVTVTRPDTTEFEMALESLKIELLTELGLEASFNALHGR